MPAPAVIAGALSLGKVFLEKAFDIVDQKVEDKDAAVEIKHEIQKSFLNMDLKELEGAVSIITAEAEADSWLTRSWRPITMLTFVALIVAKWLGLTAPGVTEAIEIELLSIIKVGLGGYVIGRSAERVVDKLNLKMIGAN